MSSLAKIQLDFNATLQNSYKNTTGHDEHVLRMSERLNNLIRQKVETLTVGRKKTKNTAVNQRVLRKPKHSIPNTLQSFVRRNMRRNKGTVQRKKFDDQVFVSPAPMTKRTVAQRQVQRKSSKKSLCKKDGFELESFDDLLGDLPPSLLAKFKNSDEKLHPALNGPKPADFNCVLTEEEVKVQLEDLDASDFEWQ